MIPSKPFIQELFESTKRAPTPQAPPTSSAFQHANPLHGLLPDTDDEGDLEYASSDSEGVISMDSWDVEVAQELGMGVSGV